MANENLHVNIPSDQRHFPKGFEAASVNTRPLKDSSGNLVWSSIPVDQITRNLNGTVDTPGDVKIYIAVVDHDNNPSTGVTRVYITDDATASGAAIFTDLDNAIVTVSAQLDVTAIEDIPIATIKHIDASSKFVEINLVESNTTNTLIISSAEGLEIDDNTFVKLHLQIIGV